MALGVLMAVASALRSFYQPYLLRKEIAVLAVVALGGVAYVALLFAVRAIKPADLRKALKRPPRTKGSGSTETLGDLS